MEVQHSLGWLSHVLSDFKEGQLLLLYLHIQEGCTITLQFHRWNCCGFPLGAVSGVKLAIGASVILQEVKSLKVHSNIQGQILRSKAAAKRAQVSTHNTGTLVLQWSFTIHSIKHTFLYYVGGWM